MKKTSLSAALTATIALVAVPAMALDYIDVPRGTFIDTGFKPDSNTRVVMDVTVQNTFEYWFGAWNVAWDNGAFAVCNDGGNVYVAYGSGNQCGGSGRLVPGGRHVLDYSNGVFRIDGNVHTTRTGTFGALNHNLYLFAQNRGGAASPHASQGAIRCHSCKIFDNGTLIRDYVPTNVPSSGFFDKVAGTFFEVKPAAAPPPAAAKAPAPKPDPGPPPALPYTDVPKGAFIDTEFKPDSNTRVVMDVTVQSEFEYWFGAWSIDWDFFSFAVCNDGNGVFSAYGSNSYDATPCGTTEPVVPEGRHVLDYDKGVFKVDGAVHTTRTGSFGRLGHNLYLFAQNRVGNATPHGKQGAIRCHSCQIYDNGTLVRDYVHTNLPSAGFFEKIGGKFHAAVVPKPPAPPPAPPAEPKGIVEGEDLPADNVRADLGGKTVHVRNWNWPGWNGYYMSITNGTLSVSGGMNPKHGGTDIWAGGTLRFEEGATYMPGAGDAQSRTTHIWNGGTLDLSHGGLKPFSTAFVMEPGSTVMLGCDLLPMRKCHNWRITGGRLVVTKSIDIKPDHFVVVSNAVLEVDVAKDAVADMSEITLEGGAQLKATGKGILIRSHDDPRWAQNYTRRTIDRMNLHAYGDGANRCYCVYFAIEATSVVKRVTYDCPEFGKISTDLPYYQIRYPEGCRGPFKVKATIEAKDGTVVSQTIEVPFNDNPLRKPFPNDDIALGMVCYGTGRERYEMITNDLANLYVRWGAWPQFLPENANTIVMPNWIDEAARKGIRSMVIYGRVPQDKLEEVRAAWGDRYIGHNIGEKTGFFYGAPNHMPGPKNLTLTGGRQWFLTSFFRHGDVPGLKSRPKDDPFGFATSGAAFANYELPAGIDYVCNELYACGCASLTYATAENRGASRKWGPEWWSGWLAHEWQTQSTPYSHENKYLSLEAGIKSLYVMGTSLMALESGSSGAQAIAYTWGTPEEDRKKGYGYFSDAARRYRETIRKCYKFIKENPRAKGTPETKIALGLGCNDGYIGMATVPWAQHDNNRTYTNGPVRVWGPSHPEQTWDRARWTFFPGSGTVGADGMPYGQVDVIGIDDQTRLSDISRYSLIAFGGWNTMTPRAKTLLEKWMANGGTFVLALPQCLTRDDREFMNYGVEDLLIPFGVKVTGFETVDGVEVARIAPNAKIETVETVGNTDVPLVVSAQVGKGRFYLMLAKRFPGADNRLGGIWQKLLADRASEVEQSLKLEQANPDDQLRFFNSAAYDGCAYVLNLDMHKERKVIVHLDGKTQELTLAPLELRPLPRK